MATPTRAAKRSAAVALAAGLVACGLLLFAGSAARAWHGTKIAGAMPPLQFTMTRASDGKQVTAADFKGKITLLYFGYTYCPDVCPTTLLNLTNVLKLLGPRADDVRVLFVTVDPHRDTLPVLKQYVEAFAPQVVGLRGTPDELAALAKRYRVYYSVKPASNGKPYEVSHGSGVYAFDRNGNIQLLFSGLSSPGGSLADTEADLRQLVSRSGQQSLWDRILHLL